MDQLEPFMAEIVSLVDRRLDELVPSDDTEPHKLHSAIRWSLFAGGKRFRPALLIATGRAFGSSDERLLTTAAAIEMIHTYSLIHDDLPSMDDDDLRRGRATCHIRFGEATATLAGDALQSLAFQSIANDGSLTESLRLRLIGMIAEASGTPSGMVAGQQRDLDAEGHDAGLEQTEQIHRRKTGALIAAAGRAGAMIAGADGSAIESIQRFSEHLGLLFQITDDLLDVTQSTSSLGKTAGKDAADRKATYPAVLGIADARRRADEIAAEAANELAAATSDPGLLGQLIDLVSKRRN